MSPATKPDLADPLQVGHLTFKNRFVGLPVGLSGYIDGSASPTERMVAHYRRRAMGGSALVTVEGCYIEPYEASRPGLLGFYSDKQLPQFAVLTDAIRQAGALSAIQVMNRWHADFPYEMDDLSVAQIEEMIGHYVRAGVRARTVGFDAINIEVAHGWPLVRFASPLTNHRHDRYGDYSYVPSEVIHRIRSAVGNSLAIIVRLSIIEDLHGGQGITLQHSLDELCPAFEAAGADVLDLSFGLGPIARLARDYKATETIYAEPGDKFEYFKAVKERVGVPVIGRSRANEPEVARRAVSEGWVDLLGLGRPLLADPDFPRKTLEGRDDEINRCIMCQFCQRVTVGLGRTLHCTVNSSLGRELEAAWSGVGTAEVRHHAEPKRVLVVGGGPAGMEAALELADRGCDVTLVERTNRLGGLMTLVPNMPHLRLRDLAYLVERQTRRLQQSSVKVHLGTEFTAGVAGNFDAEAVVLAIGSEPFSESAASAGLSVLTALDYLAGKPLGRRVVVDGHGEGAEFAVSLARSGHEVTLVEASAGLLRAAPYDYAESAARGHLMPYDYAYKRSQALSDYLVEDRVTAHWSSRVSGVEGGAVVVERHNGFQTRVEADALLVAGRRPLPLPSLDALRRRGCTVYAIGDCKQPRGLAEALDEARAIANSIAG